MPSAAPLLLGSLAYPLSHAVTGGRPGPYLHGSDLWIVASENPDVSTGPNLVGYKNGTRFVAGPSCATRSGSTGPGAGETVAYPIWRGSGTVIDVAFEDPSGNLTTVQFDMSTGAFGTPSASGISVTPGSLGQLTLTINGAGNQVIGHYVKGSPVYATENVSGTWGSPVEVDGGSQPNFFLDNAGITSAGDVLFLFGAGSGGPFRTGQKQWAIFNGTSITARGVTPFSATLDNGTVGAPLYDSASDSLIFPFVPLTSAQPSLLIASPTAVPVFSVVNIAAARSGSLGLGNVQISKVGSAFYAFWYRFDPILSELIEYSSTSTLAVWGGVITFWQEILALPTPAPNAHGIMPVYLNSVGSNVGVIIGLPTPATDSWPETLFAFSPSLPNPAPATLTLIKKVVGGAAKPTDWILSASGGGSTLVGSGVAGPAAITPGTYLLGESAGPFGYRASAWSKTGAGTLSGASLTLGPGESAVCAITNTSPLPVVPPQAPGNIIFVDTFSHYNQVISGCAKWTTFLGSVSFLSSGRPGADPAEQQVNMGSLSSLSRHITPGYTTVCGGIAYKPGGNDGTFGNFPIAFGLLNNSELIVIDLGAADGTFAIGYRNDAPEDTFDVEARLWKDHVFVGGVSGVIDAANPRTGPSTVKLDFGVWCYLELRISSRNGTVMDTVSVTPPGGGDSCGISACYVTDGEFLGEIFPAVLYPDRDGAVNSGIPSSGTSNFEMLFERPPALSPDNDATYTRLVDIGDKQLCGLDAIRGAPIIWGLQAVAHIKKASAGPAAYQMLLRNAQGAEVILKLAPLSSQTDWYPSYSPDNVDYSRMSTAALRLSPFTRKFWTIAEINSLQLGIVKVPPESTPGIQALIMTSSFEGGSPFSGWTDSVNMVQVAGRHGDGASSDGNHNWINIGSFPSRISVGTALLLDPVNGSSLQFGPETEPAAGGSRTLQLVVANGALLFIAFENSAAFSAAALQTLTWGHWYQLEGTLYISGDTLMGVMRLNGQTILSFQKTFGSPCGALTSADQISGGTTILDDWYVNNGEVLGDGWAQSGGAYVVDPDPELRITWMGLEVVQGPPGTSLWNVSEA